MKRGVGLGSLLFLHLAFLFSLQGSGHLPFAPTSAKDQKQKTYPGTPEVKVTGTGGCGWCGEGQYGGVPPQLT